jgi:glucosamine-6-phosphate deaminase
VAIVPGLAKRAAIRAAVRGPVTTACPASILRRHRDATLFLDEDSAAGLGEGKPPEGDRRHGRLLATD